MNCPMMEHHKVESLLRYRLLDPLDDLLLEYADYVGITAVEMRRKYDQLAATNFAELIGPEIKLLPLLLSSHQLPHLFHRLQIMLGFTEGFPSGSSVLDIGAGTGRDCVAWARSGFRVTHADIPWEGVEFAAWRYARRNLNVTFADARELPEERYNIISCHDVFEHVEDPVELLTHFVSRLAPDGLLFVSLDLFNPIPTHTPKNDFYATIFDPLLVDLGLEIVMGRLLGVHDASIAAMRVYFRKSPAMESFRDEDEQLRGRAYAFAERELGVLRERLNAEHDRVRQLSETYNSATPTL
jgi:2-polyprenyl-3-methyl-5-hydroxy-6-metoxy-1,4-benzoquinol methylase